MDKEIVEVATGKATVQCRVPLEMSGGKDWLRGFATNRLLILIVYVG